MDALLPPAFAAWFARRGWRPRAHQLALLEAARAGRSTLLIAPTGAGKTLAGFLPALIALSARGAGGLHTLYVSPLKALATDVARNLLAPVAEMGLGVRIETRTGDTPANRRARQRERPPEILLTTPESLALLLSLPDAGRMFAGLAEIIVDEAHALAGTKRGDLLALGLARLAALAPGVRRVGLSATVSDPPALADWLDPAGEVAILAGAPRPAPEVSLLLPDGYLPWGGHMGLAAAGAILERIRAARLAIVFVNTRAQAEMLFAELWKRNAQTLPIALHHGSLEIAQRRKVEAAMAAGRLRAVVATSSLDLGIDWQGVDLVIQVGAPKGVSRLLQRIGRANHRAGEASRAVLVPANRFEVLECHAAMAGVAAGTADGEGLRPGGLDVLAQHLLGMACAAPFDPDAMFAEVRRAGPYRDLARTDFDDVLGFVTDGGYALAAYDRYRKLFTDAEGRVEVRSARVARQYRMNIGTIVAAPLVRVRVRRGPVLGEVEEYFVATLSPGDTFLFAGRRLAFLGMRETVAEVADAGAGEPRIPAYAGGRLPLSTHLAARVRGLLQDRAAWQSLPEPVREWLGVQRGVSRLPGREDLLVETFPRGGRFYLVAYGFEGRNAHQTLGMLLTRRLERAGAGPLGFVATDYALGLWCAYPPHDVPALFDEDMLGEDLENWLAESAMMKRLFRTNAVIAGLIERQHPGLEKSRRQVTVHSDLLYDVLRRHQPGHVLLRAARADAAGGMVDLGRVAAMLRRVRGRVRHLALSRISPLAVPVLVEIGRERVLAGTGEDDLLAEAETLAAEAMGSEALPPAAAGGRQLRLRLA